MSIVTDFGLDKKSRFYEVKVNSHSPHLNLVASHFL